jgi:type IV pilus assembly protein PilA
MAIALPALMGKLIKARQVEGKNNIGQVNRAQQAYFLEQGKFSDSFADLGIGKRTQTENYDYSMRVTPSAVFNYAIPRKKRMKGYVGAVFLIPGDEATGESSTKAIACETKSSWLSNWDVSRPGDPIVRGKVIECPPNTRDLSR